MRVLILSDNLALYQRIKVIIERKSLSNVFFDFKCSPSNNSLRHLDEFKNDTSIIDVNADHEYLLANFDLIISAHCKQFFPAYLVNSIRCVNIHPGFNPINRGWYPQVFAIINDLPIGATIHEMDNKLDNGPIICRSLVEKYDWDTSDSLYTRIIDKEIEIFEQNFEEIIWGNYNYIIPENKGNFYNQSDFKKLCEIDLNSIGTFKEFYNKLRALSHENYWNAYFINEKGGKIFIKIKTLNDGN